MHGVINNWKRRDRFQSNCRYNPNVFLHAHKITTKLINQDGQCEVQDSNPDAPKYGEPTRDLQDFSILNNTRSSV